MGILALVPTSRIVWESLRSVARSFLSDYRTEDAYHLQRGRGLSPQKHDRPACLRHLFSDPNAKGESLFQVEESQPSSPRGLVRQRYPVYNTKPVFPIPRDERRGQQKHILLFQDLSERYQITYFR